MRKHFCRHLHSSLISMSYLGELKKKLSTFGIQFRLLRKSSKLPSVFLGFQNIWSVKWIRKMNSKKALVAVTYKWPLNIWSQGRCRDVPVRRGDDEGYRDHRRARLGGHADRSRQKTGQNIIKTFFFIDNANGEYSKTMFLGLNQVYYWEFKWNTHNNYN